MKKYFVFILACAFAFCACEKDKGDVLKGIWTGDGGINSSVSSASEITEMTLVFDGKGNFTWTIVDFEKRVTKGTYKIDRDIVRLFYSQTNYEGITKDYETDLEMDFKSDPPTLTLYATDQYGNILQIGRFEKQ